MNLLAIASTSKENTDEICAAFDENFSTDHIDQLPVIQKSHPPVIHVNGTSE